MDSKGKGLKNPRRAPDKGEAGGSSPPRPTIQNISKYASIRSFALFGDLLQKTVLSTVCQLPVWPDAKASNRTPSCRTQQGVHESVGQPVLVFLRRPPTLPHQHPVHIPPGKHPEDIPGGLMIKSQSKPLDRKSTRL